MIGHNVPSLPEQPSPLHTPGMSPRTRAAGHSVAAADAPAGRGRSDERRTQAERSESTRTLLVRTARDLFAKNGFAGTSIEDIASAASVTKGALYHHFVSKEELFEAVFEAEQRAIADQVFESIKRRRGALQRIAAGCEEFLNVCMDSATRQLLLIDAPAVLSDRQVERIWNTSWLPMLVSGLEKAMAEGAMARRPAEPLAHIIFGGLCQGSIMAAQTEDPRASLNDVRREVKRLINALQIDRDER